MLRVLPATFEPVNNLICCKTGLMWVVLKSTTSLFNSFFSSVARQVACFFCCPFFHTFNSTESKREAFDNDLEDKVRLSKKKVSPPDFFEKEKERRAGAFFLRQYFKLLSTECLLEKSLPFPGISWTEFVDLILINETTDIF